MAVVHQETFDESGRRDATASIDRIPCCGVAAVAVAFLGAPFENSQFNRHRVQLCDVHILSLTSVPPPFSDPDLKPKYSTTYCPYARMVASLQ